MPSAKPVPPSATQTVPTLPVPRAPDRLPSTIATLAAIPEEEIRLHSQKSARTRRAYRSDVAHFLRTLAIATPAELRQVDHKAVIAWEGFMRESEGAAPSTVRRRLAALSSLFKHLVRHGEAARNPVAEIAPGNQSRRGIDPRLRQGASAQDARCASRGYGRGLA